jgi:transcriptional regulator with XRE-family HTH domain
MVGSGTVRADTVVSASLIREARMRAGLSQAQLAERSSKAKIQIGRWETGTVAPSLDTLLEILHVCGFDLPLILEEHRPLDDRGLVDLQRSSPERRLDLMLKRLGSAEPR